MANVKISDLVAAPNAVSTMQFETNNSGISQRVTLSQMFVNASLLGVPTAPIASNDNNSNQIATTAFARSIALGIGQTWASVTEQRAFNTWFTNASGKPITVIVVVHGFLANTEVMIAVNPAATIVIDAFLTTSDATSDKICLQGIIPPGVQYQVETAGSQYMVIDGWVELK